MTVRWIAFLPSGEVDGSRAMVTSFAEGLDALRRGREEVVIADELGGEVRLVVVVRERRVRRGGMLVGM